MRRRRPWESAGSVGCCKMQITAQVLIEAGSDMHTLQAFTKTAIEIHVAQTTGVT